MLPKTWVAWSLSSPWKANSKCSSALLDGNSPTGQTIEALCDHPPALINVMPVTMETTEHLCVSCSECENLRLINLDNLHVNPVARLVTGRKKVTTAYTGLKVWRMCHDKSNILYTVDELGKITMLKTSGTNFTFQGILKKIDMHVWDMCYMKGHRMLVLRTNRRLEAVRRSDGQIVWNRSTQQIDGSEYSRCQLVYLPEMDVVLVGAKRKIKVVFPGSGSSIN